MNNALFEKHSWYFRNALVRANYSNHTKNIHATHAFLLRFFESLLLGKQHDLSNRNLHVKYSEPTNTQTNRVNYPVNRSILQRLKQNPKANYVNLAKETGCSTSTIKRHLQVLKKQGKIARVGNDKTGHWKL